MADSGRRRLVFLLPGGASLLAGLWVGLLRLGWFAGDSIAAAAAPLAPMHGPFMVAGFLGTLVSLERAVALGRRWAYAVPAVSGLGALALLAGLPVVGGALLTVAGAGLVGLFTLLGRREPSPHMAVMTAGALALLGGDLTWLARKPVSSAAWWWVGFLVLTIVGERMELNRVRRLPRWGAGSLGALAGALIFALGLAAVWPAFGVRLVGGLVIGLAAWLLAFDVARRTVRTHGLTRFVAWCLLLGYGWLGAAGVLAVVFGPEVAGPIYDAELHAVFVGFVLSMILGHAPVILPAVLRVAIPYRAHAYGPLILLHATLVLREAGDLFGMPLLRRWGGLGNVAAVVLFVGLTIATVLAARPAPADGLSPQPRRP